MLGNSGPAGEMLYRRAGSFAEIVAAAQGACTLGCTARVRVPLLLETGTVRASGGPMLRVTVHIDSCDLRLRLEGRLAGPWVTEVEQCWQTLRQDRRGRAVTVDLRDVDFVDRAGEQLLTSIYQHGAKLMASGLMTQGLVSRITCERPVKSRIARP